MATWSSTGSGGFTSGYTGSGGFTIGTGNFSGGGTVDTGESTRTTSTSTSVSLANPASITTITTQKFDNGVLDVSIIPYMRHRLIQFAASGMRPNRKVYFFFDDTSIDDYIIKLDEMELVESNTSIFNDGLSNNDTIRTSSSNTATVVQASRYFDFSNATPALNDDAKPRTRRRILRLANSSRAFANSEGFVGSVTGTTGTVGALKIQGGETLQNFFANSSSNTIQLPAKTVTIPNNYWGTDASNTIILMPRKHRKGRTVRAYITGFANATQTLYLSSSNTAGAIRGDDDEIGSNSTNQVSWTIGGDFYTDYEGKIAGVFSVPNGVFRTGERVFRIIDDPANDPADCTTRAEYRFVSSGLQLTKNDIVLASAKTLTIQPPPPPTVRPTIPRSRDGHGDPIAQTFFVDATEYPNGIFLSGVGLYFYNRDEVLPIKIEIRPTVNGYPHSYEVLPYSETSLGAEYVKTSLNGTVETKFKFDVPVYLEPGEYALVVKTDSLQYEVFVSELGAKVLGTNQIVSEQPYLGSFFKSQNASTWDAIQLEDLTFKLYKCVFASSGDITFFNEKPDTALPADLMFATIDDVTIPNTSIQYVHNYEGLTPVDSYIPGTNFRPTSRVTIPTTNGQYRLKALMTTNDRNVSPVIMNKSGTFLAVENLIDNAEFESADFVITKPGYYSANINGTVPITVTDYRGTSTQTVAYGNVNSLGNIANIVVTSTGTGFINTAAAIVTMNSGSPSTNAVITMASDTDASGGPALAKYISRVVTLAEGFDAGDLRIFLTAYKPSGTDIKVYYKVKSAEDSDTFSTKGYVLMNQKTNSNFYSGKNNFNEAIEYEFEPFETPISYTSASTTYSAFNQFSIKIVLTTDDTTNVPIVYDMRAVALPAMDT